MVAGEGLRHHIVKSGLKWCTGRSGVLQLRARFVKSYHCGMKMTYIFAAILVCSVIGALVPTRMVKTLLLLLSGALAAYGLYRLLG